MLLTETIKNSTSAIRMRRAAVENKQHMENYSKALVQLNEASNTIQQAIDCSLLMAEKGIISSPVISSEIRDNLLSCINDCGNAINERTLTLDTVKLLQSQGDNLYAQIKIVWKDSATKYSEGTKGYLSMIGGLTDNPQQSKKLAEDISAGMSAAPTVKVITKLVDDVTAAKQITDSFQLNPAIEAFLQKVSDLQATVLDLTPEILTWLKGHKLVSKLKLRF